MRYKILVVDDEKHIVTVLKDFFELEDFLVYTAYDGYEALEKLKENPDIILLDVNMPQMDGLELCKKIRDFVSCPILFLTARVSEEDCIKGFMVGGDDYILKPFRMEELSARIKAHLRRERRPKLTDSNTFWDEIVIRYTERCVYYQDQMLTFTKTEFDILEVLSLNPNQVFTKESLYEKIWGFDKDGDSNIITEHIRRIRSKFGKYTDNILIETVWGVGYRWIG